MNYNKFRCGWEEWTWGVCRHSRSSILMTSYSNVSRRLVACNSSTTRTAEGSSKYPVTHYAVYLFEPQLTKHWVNMLWTAYFLTSSWTTHESDLTLYADFEFVGMSPGEPGSPGSAECQECHSRCRNEWRLVNGRSGTARLSRRHFYEPKVSRWGEIDLVTSPGDQLCGQFQSINRLLNQLSRQFQLMDSLPKHLSRQFQLIDSLQNQLAGQLQMVDRLLDQLSGQLQ